MEAQTRHLCYAWQILAINIEGMVGAGVGGLSKSFNKRNIHEKIFFQIVLNKVVKYDIC